MFLVGWCTHWSYFFGLWIMQSECSGFILVVLTTAIQWCIINSVEEIRQKISLKSTDRSTDAQAEIIEKTPRKVITS